jgi:quinol-cytochrome oxidoreductase complex cytochrome b subunit
MAVFEIHIPILDEIKEKGLKPAMMDMADGAVERLTSGLGIADVRSILRDDPPGRPNPRLQPHSEGFWLHMKPTYYNKLMDGIYPTFRLGWLSTFFFVFEIITGIFLMIYYTPSPSVAYENMLVILSNVPFGRFMRDTHKLGAELMVAVVLLHMLRTFITGSYKKPREFTWASGFILLLVTLVLSFSGYLLPWDQLSLWAVTIGASMVEAAPPEIVGKTLNLIVRGAPEFGANGLLRFYLVHVLFLPLVGVTYYVFALLAVMAVWSTFIFHAPLESHAEPLITPLHVTSPWYFLWLQGMLKLGDKVIWGIVIPTVLLGGLLFLPYVELGPSRRYGHRRIGLSGAALAVAVFVILSFMGTPWFGVETSPEEEAVAVLLPQTHPGPIRLADWDDLEVGVYEAATWSTAPTETLRDLLHTFDEEIVGAVSDERTSWEGLMVIEDWQPGLKKITLRVLWIDVATGDPGEFSETTYFHENSNYGQGE